MNGRIFAHITATRVKWEQDVSVLAAEKGVTPDEIRQQYSIGWSVDGKTGEITYNDNGSGDYRPDSDTVRMEDPIEEHGWVDRSWDSRVLYDSRNDVGPVVSQNLEDVFDLYGEVNDALEWLPGGFDDNGDGTFYAADSESPFGSEWDYSYAIHFTRKFLSSTGWTEEPWLDAVKCFEGKGHNVYPHTPGTLYDCLACQEECFCEEGFTCVYCADSQ